MLLLWAGVPICKAEGPGSFQLHKGSDSGNKVESLAGTPVQLLNTNTCHVNKDAKAEVISLLKPPYQGGVSMG